LHVYGHPRVHNDYWASLDHCETYLSKRTNEREKEREREREREREGKGREGKGRRERKREREREREREKKKTTKLFIYRETVVIVYSHLAVKRVS
jgi:hypothetical protein